MDIIRDQNETEKKFLGEQKVNFHSTYRRMKYTIEAFANNHVLLYNSLTSELLAFKAGELEGILDERFSNKDYEHLIKNYYLVPDTFNEEVLCKNLNDLLRTFYETSAQGQPITNYTILTTTECNARCFYCYESGRAIIRMTEEIAEKVAEFIIKNAKKHPVNIRWFGGEPLCNHRVIDLVSLRLKESGIIFNSSMVTNGFLFDESIVQKAVFDWNLKRIQITLDGTEKTYNRVKNYVYKDVNSFKIVIDNIKHILDAGIQLRIRMNADLHNIPDLYKLVDYICEKYGHYNNISMYSRLIFENTGFNKSLSQSAKEDRFLKNLELNTYISKKGMFEMATLDNYLRYNQCMADDPTSIVILPNGKCGRCEHFSDSHFIGDIYGSDFNKSEYAYFRKQRQEIEKCLSCPIRPSCLSRIKNCPDAISGCDNLQQKGHIDSTKRRIINTFNIAQQNDSGGK